MATDDRLSLEALGDAVWMVLLRFPVAMAAATAVTAMGLSGDFFENHARWLIGLVAVFFWSVAIRVVVEGRPGASRLVRIAAPCTAVFVLATYPLSGGGVSPYSMLPAAGALAVIAAPLFVATVDRSTLSGAWARGIAWAAALGGTATGLFCIGLIALAVGTDALFDTRLSSVVTRRLPVIGLGLLLPWCALALLPSLRQDGNASRFPRWVSALLDWLLAPLTLAYGVLLNTYCLWILARWELPKSIVATMVIAFAIIGGIVWGAAFAAGADGGKATWLLRRAFLPGLLAPAAALLAAARMRIDQYGVTEERYFLVLAAVLLLALGAGQAATRRVPSPSLAALAIGASLLVASIGPWGATGVSVRNQMERLRDILERVGHVHAGTIDTAGPEVSETDAAEITSIVSFLVGRGEQARIFSELQMPPADSPQPHGSTHAQTRAIVEAMGLPFMPDGAAPNGGQDRERLSWASSHGTPIDVADFDFIVTRTVDEGEAVDIPTADGMLRLDPELSSGLLHVSRDGVRLATFDLGTSMTGDLVGLTQPVSLDAVAADATRLRLLLTRAYGTRSQAEGIHLTRVEFHLLAGRKPVERTR